MHFGATHLPFITNEIVEGGHGFYAEYLREGYNWGELEQEYRNSLRYVLEELEELIEELDGKTVITADHGEAHGEWGLRDHPHSVYIDSLVKVPWLEVE